MNVKNMGSISFIDKIAFSSNLGVNATINWPTIATLKLKIFLMI